MGLIYKIVNDVNDKVYVGQTAHSLNTRYQQHISEAGKHTQRKLYIAMNEIGVEHFSAHEIEQCPEQDLDTREKYWIAYYDSLHNGYNMTAGGNGGSIYNIDSDKVQQLWNDGFSLSYIAQIFNCSVSAISYRLRDNCNYSKEEANKRACGKPVYGYDLMGALIFQYPTANDAERAFTGKEHDNIASCCRGYSKTAYGYTWSYEKKEKGPILYDQPYMPFPVVQLTKDGEYITIYENATIAKKAMQAQGWARAHILEVCRRLPLYKTSCGYLWRSIYDNEFVKPCPQEIQKLVDLLDD